MDIKNKTKIDLPEFLIEMLNKQYGKELTNKILEGYSVKRIVSLRVNTLKSDLNTIKNKLSEENVQFETVSWSNDALIIKNVDEKYIKNMDIYTNGEIYLQSLSSMLPPIILNPKENTDILDMCAAPGGKTTQIAAMTNNNANITACEMNKIRTERLKYNIEKQGANSIYVMTKDARFIDDFFSFDKILLDAPCSGSGTLNSNNKNLSNVFTMQLINKSVSSQLTLLRKGIKILKPGEELVYSTCSILSDENEDVVSKVLEAMHVEIVPIEFESKNELPLLPVKIEGTVCVCPNEYYEGFFIAKIKKKK